MKSTTPRKVKPQKPLFKQKENEILSGDSKYINPKKKLKKKKKSFFDFLFS